MPNRLRQFVGERVVPGAIIFIGITVWAWILTGNQPPRYLLVAASLGAASSPFFYQAVARFRRQPRDEAELFDSERPD